MLYAGQEPGWISNFRDEAGLQGDEVMPRTQEEMLQRLQEKSMPLLEVLQNSDYNQLQNPIMYDYPVNSGINAVQLTPCGM